MGGGLMQLVAYGAQDIYLTGNPQITFFKVVYRRHTNFSMECVEQQFSGTPDFGRKGTVTVQRNGDLVTRMYLQTTLPALAAAGNNTAVSWVRRVGYAMIKKVDVEIGGTTIDRHYGNWMNIWHELSHDNAHDAGHDNMVGNTAALTTLSSSVDSSTLYVPLQFWFCRNTGLALPLIALQYHEVRVDVEFESFANLVCYQGDAPAKQTLGSTSLLVDYVYLDSEERRRFAQVGHEYLIEQLQFTGEDSVSGSSSKHKLNMNHPVKELVFVAQSSDNRSARRCLADPRADSYLNDAAVNLVMGMFNANMGGQAVTAAAAIVNGNSVQFAGDGSATVGNLTLTAESATTANDFTVDTASHSLNSLIDDAVVVVAGALGGAPNVTVVSVTHRLTAQALNDANVGDPADNRSAAAKANDVHVSDSLATGRNLSGSGNPVKSAKLQLNGHDRMDTRAGDYFNYVQPFQHHSNTPADGVNVYSFALKPEEHQPSGTCNMSRIDNATLVCELESGVDKLSVFGVNYNVLRIMSGMGGLAYSN